MDLKLITENLQAAGFDINQNQIKLSGKWEGSRTFDNSPGSKSGRYIIGENICSWINNKSQERGSFVLDKERIISRFDLEKKRREHEKAARDKYFINAQLAKKKYDSIKVSGNFESPYIARKGLEWPTNGKIDSKGNLYVPIYSLDIKPDGRRVSYLRSIQTILPDGTKIFEPGCEKKGNMHFLGLPSGNPGKYNDKIYVCEGLATGESLRYTGVPVVVAFDAGNLDPVMAKLTKVYPKAEFMICADNDIQSELKMGRNTGVEAAMACQKKYECAVAIPDFSKVENNHNFSDWNDLFVEIDFLDIMDQLDNAFNNYKNEKTLRLNTQSIRELINEDPTYLFAKPRLLESENLVKIKNNELSGIIQNYSILEQDLIIQSKKVNQIKSAIEWELTSSNMKLDDVVIDQREIDQQNERNRQLDGFTKTEELLFESIQEKRLNYSNLDYTRSAEERLIEAENLVKSTQSRIDEFCIKNGERIKSNLRLVGKLNFKEQSSTDKLFQNNYKLFNPENLKQLLINFNCYEIAAHQKKNVQGIQFQQDLCQEVNAISSKYAMLYSGKIYGINTNKDVLDKFSAIFTYNIEKEGKIEVNGHGSLSLSQEHPPTLAKLIAKKFELNAICDTPERIIEHIKSNQNQNQLSIK